MSKETKTKVTKKRSPKTTIHKNKTAKQHKDGDWRTKYTFWNQKGLPVAALEDLADKIIQTVKNDPNIMTLNRVYYLCDVSPYSMVNFIKKSEKLREAKEYARFVIGVNREEGALFRKIDGNITKLMQHFYDPEWGKAEERLYKLKAMSDSNGVTKDDLKDIVKDILKPVV